MKSVAIALLTIGLATLTLHSFSQENLHPAIRDFKPYIGYWSDSIGSKDTTYWPNGRIMAIYVPKNDLIKTRREYYESGNMRSIAELYQKLVIDSLFTVSHWSGEDTLTVFPYYIDILHGQYQHFHNEISEDTIMLEGTFTDGIQYGIWVAYDYLNGRRIEATFNNLGKIEGPYVEYYLFIPNKFP